MLLKKTNAAFGLLTIIALVIHAWYQMVSYVRFTHDEKMTMILAGVVMLCLLIHVVLAMCILMFANERADITEYPGYNTRTIIQRASAIGILVLLLGHISAFKVLMAGSPGGLLPAAIIQILFLGMAFAHISVSLSKALITLGIITSERTKDVLDRIMAVLCSAAFIAACVIIIKTYAALLNMGS